MALQACCDAPDNVADLASELLTCLGDTLEECEREVCRLFLAAGDVAWDNCCDGCGDCDNCDEPPGNGQAWVRVTAIYPTNTFPVPLTDPTKCSHTWGVDLEVGILRCSTALTESGGTPPAEVVTQETLGTLADARAMMAAVRCCFLPTLTCPDWVMGTWEPLGPDGGCRGGVLPIQVRLEAINLCERV